MILFNSNGTHRKTQKSKLTQKLSLQYVDLQEPYVALVDMSMIWSIATPTAEDLQTQDGNSHKWSDYVHRVSSIIDAADAEAYVVAAVISQQLSNILCTWMTGCDANSGFYGNGKKSVYDQVAKSHVARRQLSRCLELEEEVVELLFEFTRHVIYGDNNSSTVAEARAAKWNRMKNKYFIHVPPDGDILLQHCLRANYLAYLMRHLSMKHHPSPLVHGWELVGDRCRPVRHTRPVLPTHLPAPEAPEESGEDDNEDDDDEGDDDVQRRTGDFESDDSKSSEAECFDSG